MHATAADARLALGTHFLICLHHRRRLRDADIYEMLNARKAGGRHGLVSRDQMVNALVRAVENPPPAGTVRVVEVPAIRSS